jgi:rhamnosyltransferase
MKIGLCIPTRNASSYADRLVKSILEQSRKPETILIIDSDSNDGTVPKLERLGARFIRIPQSKFNHGGTRQRGVEMLVDMDVIIFLTQDAIPANSRAFELLVASLDDPEIGAVYGRQLPQPKAAAIESHARLFNYPDESCVKSIADRDILGIKSVFISNSFAAYRRADLMAVGGFPPHVIMGEDTYIAGKMLLSGKKVAYCAEATVFHSHDYSLIEEFRRYFDAGVLHAREPWIRGRFGGAEGEGLRYVRSELRYLINCNPLLIAPALLRNVLKFVGFRVGLHEARLPVSLKRRLSMFRTYWSGL